MATLVAREKFVTINDLKLRYLDWGTEGKPPLVCLHGHSGQAHIWDEFAQAVSPHFHVYALDQRGHGGSQWAGTGYARDRFVEDLAAFVDALSLPRFVLVGLSMGGWHSLLYTPDHQERVERIVMVDIAPEPSDASKQLMASRPPTPLEFSGFDDVIAWERERDSWVSDDGLRKDITDRVRQREDGKWVWKADSALFNYILPDMTSDDLQRRYWDSLEAITCPVLEVRGKESPLVSDQVVDRMRKANPRFTAVDVAGAGHVVCVDKPREFNAATWSFLGLPDFSPRDRSPIKQGPAAL